MGLWSFVKETGASLFGGKEEEVAPAPAPATPGAATAPVAASKTDIAASKEKALKAEVEKLGLDTKGLEISVEGDKVHVKGKATTAEAKEKVILAVGNVNGVAEVETDEDEDIAPVFYTVKKGDTLSAIAKSTLGNANKYNEIFEANRPMLSHPDKIYPGQMLRIPQ